MFFHLWECPFRAGKDITGDYTAIVKSGEDGGAVWALYALRSRENFGKLRRVDRRRHAIHALHLRPADWFVVTMILASTILLE